MVLNEIVGGPMGVATVASVDLLLYFYSAAI
jgi:hypothetical protein